MRAELTAFLSQFANARQREHLKTAAVGQDRALPSVEAVQSACRTQHFEARTKVEMIGVAQDDLCLDLLAKLTEVYW